MESIFQDRIWAAWQLPYDQVNVLLLEWISVERSNLLSNDDTWFLLLLKEPYNLLLVMQDQYGAVILLGDVEFFHPITDDDMHFF